MLELIISLLSKHAKGMSLQLPILTQPVYYLGPLLYSALNEWLHLIGEGVEVTFIRGVVTYCGVDVTK